MSRIRRVVASLAVAAAVAISGAIIATAYADTARTSDQVHVISVAMSGAYEYETAGTAAGLVIDRSAAGTITRIHGRVELPGHKTATATIDVKLDVLFGLIATGSVRVIDAASGLNHVTYVPLGLVRSQPGGGAKITSSWNRLWKLVEFGNYRIDLELRPATEPDSAAAEATGAPETSDNGVFSVLTYNVAGLIEPISGSEPIRNSPQISPLLNGYDIVLTQENFHFYSDLIAREVEHPFASVPVKPPLFAGGRALGFVADGLQRFSQYRFEPVDHVTWPGCFGGIFSDLDNGAGDCLAMKGFSKATTALSDGSEVDIYNLHAEAGDTARDQALQAADFELLAAYMVANSADRAVIVGGDTNLHIGDEPADAEIWNDFLAATGLTAACDTLECGPNWTRIDRFAYRSGPDTAIEPVAYDVPVAEFSNAAGEPLSDHDPVAVEFAWAATGS